MDISRGAGCSCAYKFKKPKPVKNKIIFLIIIKLIGIFIIFKEIFRYKILKYFGQHSENQLTEITIRSSISSDNFFKYESKLQNPTCSFLADFRDIFLR